MIGPSRHAPPPLILILLLVVIAESLAMLWAFS